MRFNIGAAAAAIRKRLYDNVSSRTNTTGSLGTASDGSQWTAINGTIQVTSGAATATTTPASGGLGNTYPIAAINMPTSDNIIKLGGTNEGSGVALWVQSSSDWWMVNVESNQVTNTNYAGTTYWSYNYAYQYTQANPNNYVFTTYGAYNTTPTYTYVTSAGVTSFTSGVTNYFVSTASGNPTTSGVPYSSGRDYWSSTPYTASGSTPYSSSTAYSSGNPYTTGGGGTTYTSGTAPTNYTKGPTSYYKIPPSYYLAGTSYTSGGGGTTYTAGTAPTTYTKGATTYTAGATSYTAGTTTYGAPYTVGATNYTASATIFYTAGATTYTSGAATYSTVPPGIYSSNVPYSSAVPTTSAWTTAGPWYGATNYAWTTTYGTYYFVTTSGYQWTTNATYYTYASGTTTTYNEYLKIKKSVANTVSEMTSSLISNTQTIKSLLVSVLGNQITARAYSDAGFVTQIGSDLVYTATGATVTTMYGIGVSPSAYNQSAIIGTSVDISRS